MKLRKGHPMRRRVCDLPNALVALPNSPSRKMATHGRETGIGACLVKNTGKVEMVEGLARPNE